MGHSFPYPGTRELPTEDKNHVSHPRVKDGHVAGIMAGAALLAGGLGGWELANLANGTDKNRTALIIPPVDTKVDGVDLITSLIQEKYKQALNRAMVDRKHVAAYSGIQNAINGELFRVTLGHRIDQLNFTTAGKNLQPAIIEMCEAYRNNGDSLVSTTVNFHLDDILQTLSDPSSENCKVFMSGIVNAYPEDAAVFNPKFVPFKDQPEENQAKMVEAARDYVVQLQEALRSRYNSPESASTRQVPGRG